MKCAALMIQGTGSDVGKSAVVAGLCRLLRRRGIAVAPFKPQNMSNNAAASPAGGEIGRAQALQARAAGLEPEVDMNPVLLKPQTDRTSQLVVQGRAVATVDAARYMAERGSLLAPIMASFERLADRFDLILVEGAGSPAETNLRERDVANMGFARRAGVPVCLLGDIDRGGVIAALVGTRGRARRGGCGADRQFRGQQVPRRPGAVRRGACTTSSGAPAGRAAASFPGVAPRCACRRRTPWCCRAPGRRTGVAAPGCAWWCRCCRASPTSTTSTRCAWSRQWSSASSRRARRCRAMPTW